MSALTLDQLITEACEIFAPADAPTRYYAAALTHAAAFRRAYSRKNAATVRTAYLQVGDDRTVNLPEDYANWRMLGLTFPGWASVRNLTYNAAIPLAIIPAAPTAAIDYLEPPTGAESVAAYGSIDADTEAYCGFGRPVYAAEFRIDEERGRIVCSSRLPESAVLVLEYVSFDATDGEDIAIDAMAHDWGVNFILEKLYAQKKDWNTVAYYQRQANSALLKYREDKRTFSVGNVQRAKHNAARQRWK